MKFTYLLIDILSLFVPFLLSFHPKLKFYRHWRALFPALLFSGVSFIPFDIYFTDQKVWGFNPAYVSGLYIGNLPVDEFLFFLCIPYSCVFTYYCLAILIKKEFASRWVKGSTMILLLFCISLAAIFYQHAYTAFAFVVLATLLLIAQFITKVRWLGKFYVIYGMLLLPFLIVNGLLTGTGLKQPIVWYNNAENMNVRILTIPLEDVFYGMALILLNLMVYKTLERKFYNDRKLQLIMIRSEKQI